MNPPASSTPHHRFLHGVICLLVVLSSLTAALPTMRVVAAGHAGSAPPFRGNPAQTFPLYGQTPRGQQIGEHRNALSPTRQDTAPAHRLKHPALTDRQTPQGVHPRTPRTKRSGVFHAFDADPNCPSGWSCADLDGASPAGTESLSNGTWSVTGGGGPNVDQYHYVWQATSASTVSFGARITSQTNVAGWAPAAGLMFRESTAAAARFYYAYVTPGGAVFVTYRGQTNGPGTRIASLTNLPLPLSLRISRTNFAFQTEISTDGGSSWSVVAGSQMTINMANALAGFAVTADCNCTTSTATFDSVSLATSGDAITSCPAPWTCTDIGTPNGAGSQESVDGTSWAIDSGGNIAGTTDSFHYVSQPLGVSGTVTALVSYQSPPNAYEEQAGVMVRQSTDVGSPYYYVYADQNGKVNVDYRLAQGGSVQHLIDQAITAPKYVRILRTQFTFQAQTSSDGSSWTTISGSTISLPLSSSIPAGLAVSAGCNCGYSTASFDTVSVDTTASDTAQGCPAPWACADVGQVSPGGQASIGGTRWSSYGYGGGVWSDAFHFIYQTFTTDTVSVSAEVETLLPTGGASRAEAGVMLRDNINPGSPYYSVIVTQDNKIEINFRREPNDTNYHICASGVETSGCPSIVPYAMPIFLKVARSGYTFTAYTSSDGVSWTLIPGSSFVIDMGPTLAGLLADGGGSPLPTAADFDAATATGSGSTVQSCPSPWQCADIGPSTGPGVQGRQNSNNNATSWALDGSGGLGYDSPDSLHYVYQPFPNGTFSAHVSTMYGPGQFLNTVGVMFRASTDPEAPFYYAFVRQNDGGPDVKVFYRATQGGPWQTQVDHVAGTAPISLAVTRSGTTFWASTSTDGGASWQQVQGSALSIAAMAGAGLAGLAAQSGGCCYETATFDDVLAQPGTFFVPQNGLGGGSTEDQVYCPTCAGVDQGDPVDLATGNFWHTFSDLSVPGRGLPLDLTHTYNAQLASQDSPLGYGWTDSYNLFLSTDGSGNLTFHAENGAQYAFTSPSSGVYQAPSDIFDTLVTNGDGTLTLTRLHSQEKLVFSPPTQSTAGQLLKEIDPNGDITTLTYSNGLLSTVTDPAGRALAVTYNASNRIATVSDGTRSETFSYDTSGNLTDVIDVGGGQTHFTYDSDHLLLTMEDPRQYALHGALSSGPVTTNVYDTSGRVTQQTDPLGRPLTFAYSTNTNGTTRTTITDANGNVELDDFQGGQLVKETLASGTPQQVVRQYTYDPTTLGLASVTDGTGHVWIITRDGQGNVLSTLDPLGRLTCSTYDALNNLTSMADPTVATTCPTSGVKTTYTYDESNGHDRLTQVSRPLVGTSQTATTTLGYDDADYQPEDVTSVTDPNGNQTTFTYDRYGDLASETDADGNKTTYTDDGVGRPLTMVSPRGNVAGHNPGTYTTSYRTDAFGEITSVTDPQGNQTVLSYDPNGNLLTQKDALGHTTGYSYDADNEVTGETLADNSTRGMAYDADGNVLSQSNGLGQTTTYSYNVLNQLTATVSPCGTVASGGSFCASGDSSLSASALAARYTTSDSYDLAGNLQTTTDPLGRSTTYSYDAANQLCAMDYAAVTPSCTGTHAVMESYNTLRQRIGMTDSTGSSSYAYDSLGRLTSSTDGAGHTVGYGYDLTGNLTSLTYPDNTRVTRTYDPANQLTDVTDWNGNDTHFGYDPDGNLTSESFPSSTNGTAETYSYNVADELTNIIASRTTGSSPFRWVFGSGRDGLGQVNNATDRYPGMRHSYSYDALNRLTQDTRSNRTSESWQYNAADELTSSGDTALGMANTYTYNGGDQLTQLQTTQGNSTLQNLSLSYNAMGDRIGQTESVSGTTLIFGYNQADELTTFSNAKTGVSASYTYNGDGLRTSKTVSNTTTAEVWDLAEGLPLMVQDGTTKYITGPDGLPIEQVDGSGTISYYLQDQLGSTRGLIDASGNVFGIFNYDDYGNPTGHTGTVTAPFGYAGQYTDAESGLQYLRARYYDPYTKQFLTVDPLVDLTGEPYAYSGASPLTFADPAGLDCQAGPVTIPLLGSGRCSDDVGAAIHNVAATPVSLGRAAFCGGAPVACATLSAGIHGPSWNNPVGSAFLFILPGGDEEEVGTLAGKCIEDILQDPELLRGKSPGEVERALGDTPGWRTERLGKGAHKGQGWVLRQYGDNGEPTGRMVQWHPGGGHHGPDPYWKTRSGEYGVSPEIPAGPEFP